MAIRLEVPTWFVVEGPDGAGKSTLVKHLAHALACSKTPTVVHKLDYDSRPEEYVLEPLRWTMGGFHVVQDRGALSGPVYEPLFRRDMDRLAWLEPMVEASAEAGAKVIFMTAQLPVLEARVRERGDHYIEPESLKSIVKGYDAVMHRFLEAGGRAITFDTTDAFPSGLEAELAASMLALGH